MQLKSDSAQAGRDWKRLPGGVSQEGMPPGEMSSEGISRVLARLRRLLSHVSGGSATQTT